MQTIIPELLDTEGAAKAVGLAVSSLEKKRLSGAGPRFVKLGRAVRYDPADLRAWVDANRRTSTSEVTHDA